MARKAEPLRQLYTRWGRELERTNPLPEHPRPQMRREDWQSLNGVWQYAIGQGVEDTPPADFAGEIVVPYSPESLLSGVNRQLLPGDTLWYTRSFVPAPPPGHRTLLHFDAVDQCCTVWVNGHEAGHNEGGYWAFTLEVTPYLQPGENTLLVAVRDEIDAGPHAYGKQKLQRGGIWYTATSGIWQSVWLEYVPEVYITDLAITPLYDEEAVQLEIACSAPGAEVEAAVLDGTAHVAVRRGSEGTLLLPLENFRAWSPDAPFLYTLRLRCGPDEVESYFGMRKFAVGKNARGQQVFLLNNRPLFQSGLLDQGYWSDGLYTPPADEAMVWELGKIKELGFNMVRKHIKIECMRWYYHCDRLGLLVWQDFVNGGAPQSPMVTQVLPFIGRQLDDGRYQKFGRQSPEGRVQFERDLPRTVKQLYNVVSLCVWVPFNEGWGQFDSVRIAGSLRALDATRPIDAASGWHDNGGGDFHSVHVYYKRFRFKPDATGQNRAEVLSEFGGYSHPVPGHMATQKLFGYRMYKTRQALSSGVEALYRRDVLPYIERGLCAAVYTQVSDVEEEINGLFSFDREVMKLDERTLQAINAELLKA